MKAITINVSEPVYRGFKEYARLHDRSTSALIREAMEEYLTGRLQAKTSLRDLKPVSVGKVLKELSSRDDLLGEMIHGSGR
jgi:hypothetical protein